MAAARISGARDRRRSEAVTRILPWPKDADARRQLWRVCGPMPRQSCLTRARPPAIVPPSLRALLGYAPSSQSPPMPRKTVLVQHFAGLMPLAGIAWQAMHYVLALKRLGFDVWYVED